MTMIAKTPLPPYYAVIFSSTMTKNHTGYSEMSDLMMHLAAKQDGFLGVESARNEIGITVSYWKDLESINNWKMQTDHEIAQENGKYQCYAQYKVRISKVERDYEFER